MMKKKLQEQIECIACEYVDNSCAANKPHCLAEGISLANDARLVGISQGHEGHEIIKILV